MNCDNCDIVSAHCRRRHRHHRRRRQAVRIVNQSRRKTQAVRRRRGLYIRSLYINGSGVGRVFDSAVGVTFDSVFCDDCATVLANVL